VSDESVVVVVPVREGSQRINDKNFRPFNGYPTLLHQKIVHLRDAGCFEHIYISSDSDRVRRITEECGAEYLPRDPYMCTSKPRWDEVVVSVMEDIPSDPHVAWAMVTSPLFSNYAPAVQKYLDALDSHDSLVAVKKVREYLMDEAGRPLFTGYGVWHPYTTEIKPLYAISDALFVARKRDQIKWRYWFGPQPLLYEVSPIEAIDVNFEEDLQLAYAALGAAPGRATTGS
jgi:CMP-N-acetylneuraminic acid synthetase